MLVLFTIARPTAYVADHLPQSVARNKDSSADPHNRNSPRPGRGEGESPADAEELGCLVDGEDRR